MPGACSYVSELSQSIPRPSPSLSSSEEVEVEDGDGEDGDGDEEGEVVDASGLGMETSFF